MRLCRTLLFGCLLVLPAGQCLNAQDDAKTHEVKKGFFQVVETVQATVESKTMHPLAADTETWTDLKISWIVPEGTVVSAGDEIVKFDTEKIDTKILEAEQAIQLGKLTLQGTELELEQLSRTLSLDQALADRARRNAEQDFEYFNNVGKPNQERSVRRSVENSQHSLEYAQEEYNQLKRMYEEDELTEESEEIVLKRTERDVENRQFYLEQSQIRAARTLDYDLPRELEQKTDELERAKLEHEKSQITLPLELDKKRVATEKARYSLEKEQKDLADLLADRQRMTLTAPADGIVYYGRCVRGAWQGQSGPQRNLELGKSIAHDKTLVTLIDPEALFLRADISENQLAFMPDTRTAIIKFPAFPNERVFANVTSFSNVPVQADKFDCQLELDSPVSGLMPGMTGQLTFYVYQNKEALTVPESAVFSDHGVDRYVLVAGQNEDDPPEQRSVEVGRTADKKIEITSGLNEGEKVLLERPN